MSGVLVRSIKDNSARVLPASGVFIYVGSNRAQIFDGQRILDEQGYIITGADMATSIPGVYAAGDVRTTPLRQIVSAAGDGVVAAMYAYQYLETL